MAPYNVNIIAQIQTNDGYNVQNTAQFLGLTAKEQFDVILPAGTFDFSPYLANFPNGIKGILIIAQDAHFLLSVDGVNFSAISYKMFLVQVDTPGTQALKITLAAQSRVQFIAVGS